MHNEHCQVYSIRMETRDLQHELQRAPQKPVAYYIKHQRASKRLMECLGLFAYDHTEDHPIVATDVNHKGDRPDSSGMPFYDFIIMGISQGTWYNSMLQADEGGEFYLLNRSKQRNGWTQPFRSTSLNSWRN